MKAKHLFLLAFGVLAYLYLRRTKQLIQAIAELEKRKDVTIILPNQEKPVQIIHPATPVQVVNPDKPVKFIKVNIPDGADFDMYLTAQAELSESLNDCRVVQFLFESDNLSNYYLICGNDAQMIAQFL